MSCCARLDTSFKRHMQMARMPSACHVPLASLPSAPKTRNAQTAKRGDTRTSQRKHIAKTVEIASCPKHDCCVAVSQPDTASFAPRASSQVDFLYALAKATIAIRFARVSIVWGAPSVNLRGLAKESRPASARVVQLGSTGLSWTKLAITANAPRGGFYTVVTRLMVLCAHRQPRQHLPRHSRLLALQHRHLALHQHRTRTHAWSRSYVSQSSTLDLLTIGRNSCRHL